MSELQKKEPIIGKDAREPEQNASYIVSGATALDQINISIKFKSRDDLSVATSVKNNVDLQAPVVGTSVKNNVDLQAPNPGSTPRQNYVTLEQFETLKEQVQRLTEQLKRSSKNA